jgi:hypothetical protein
VGFVEPASDRSSLSTSQMRASTDPPPPTGGSIRVRVTSRARHELFEGGLLLLIAAVVCYEILVVPVPYRVVLAVVAIGMVIVADRFLTDGLSMNGGGPSTVQVSQEGLSAHFRPESSYRQLDKGFGLRSAILRIPLPGFGGPNVILWSRGAVARVMATPRPGFIARCHLDFRGRDAVGPRRMTHPLTLWIPDRDLVPVIEYITRGGGHVHADASLLKDWKGPWRRCDLYPSHDPRYGGICVPRSYPRITSLKQ